MNIKCIKVGGLETNCYVLEKNGKVLIIDPGEDFLFIKNSVVGEVVGILITHNHFDHVGALNECIEYFNVKKYDYNNLIEGINKIDCFEFLVNYNLGHTMDSISFIFDEVMFSGDFIFKGAIGRCDLGGNFKLMQDSIKKILLKSINYKIYPGHGDYTFLDDERNNLNKYI